MEGWKVETHMSNGYLTDFCRTVYCFCLFCLMTMCSQKFGYCYRNLSLTGNNNLCLLFKLTDHYMIASIAWTDDRTLVEFKCAASMQGAHHVLHLILPTLPPSEWKD